MPPEDVWLLLLCSYLGPLLSVTNEKEGPGLHQLGVADHAHTEDKMVVSSSILVEKLYKQKVHMVVSGPNPFYFFPPF